MQSLNDESPLTPLMVVTLGSLQITRGIQKVLGLFYKLVFFGQRDHNVLGAEDPSDRDEYGGIQFSTDDVAKLRFIEEDAPFSEARLYKDGAERRGMRGVVLERLEVSDEKVVARLKYEDDSLKTDFSSKDETWTFLAV